MKLAILETGRPPGDLADRFGDYPAMFGELLGPGFEIEKLRRPGRRAARTRRRTHAYLITGSPAGVYDPLPWIGRCMTSSAPPRTARWSASASVIR